MRKFASLLAIVTLVALAIPAAATPMNWNGGADGVTWNITWDSTSFSMSLDSSACSFNSTSCSGIGAISFHGWNGPLTFSNVTEPSGWTAPTLGPASTNNCNDVQQGSICFPASGQNPLSSSYTFSADVAGATGTITPANIQIQLFQRCTPPTINPNNGKLTGDPNCTPVGTSGDGYKNLTLISVNDSTTPPVPEPASMVLFGTGLVAITGAVRRRMRR